MATLSARQWRHLYAAERHALGATGLEALIARAPDVALPVGGALVFPHTRLRDAGHLVAAVARAVVRSGCDEVVALGVLHGGREEDAAIVARARAGDADAKASMRRVHGEGIPGDAGHWTEEFSLDGFAALVEVAARVDRRKCPRLVKRFPFLVGAAPSNLPGFDALARLREGGAALVATADPIHHGAGYGTPEAERRSEDDAASRAFAYDALALQYDALARGDYDAFQDAVLDFRSDFRDAGPVLAELLRARGPFAMKTLDLTLVDYASTLDAPRPTWVCAALTEATTSP